MADFNKAKRKKINNSKKWYVINTKNYQVYFWALPILPIIIMIDKFENWQYERRTWNDEKAKKVLDKILPKVLEWVEEDNAFYYCMSWSSWSLYNHAPFGYRKWVKKFNYELQKFIRYNYEDEKYIKTIEDNDYDDIWIKFSEK